MNALLRVYFDGDETSAESKFAMATTHSSFLKSHDRPHGINLEKAHKSA